MEDFFDFIFDRPVLIFLIIILICFVFVPLISYTVEKYIYTPNFRKTVKRPVRYNFWAGGCFVNIGGNNWIPCDKYVGIIKGESK